MYIAAIIIGLVALVVVGVVAGRAMTRRRRASAHRTPHAALHPESLLADLDDRQHEVELSARRWRARAAA